MTNRRLSTADNWDQVMTSALLLHTIVTLNTDNHVLAVLVMLVPSVHIAFMVRERIGSIKRFWTQCTSMGPLVAMGFLVSFQRTFAAEPLGTQGTFDSLAVHSSLVIPQCVRTGVHLVANFALMDSWTSIFRLFINRFRSGTLPLPQPFHLILANKFETSYFIWLNPGKRWNTT